MIPTDLHDLPIDEYECEIRTNVFWDPMEHFGILHRRENRTERPNAIVDIQRTLRNLKQVWEENERREGEFRRKVAARQQGRLGGKPPKLYLLNMEKMAEDFARQRSKNQTPALQIPAMNYLKDELIDFRLDALSGQPDIYISQNAFIKWRQEANWASLGALYLDFDRPNTIGLNENELAMHILQFCDEVELPRPSYIMFTGVGCAAVWLHSYCHRPKDKTGAISRWHAAEKHLHKIFGRSAIGELLDPAVKDPTRVLRLAGTVNSKSGETVRPLFINGPRLSPKDYAFKSLCDSIFKTKLQEIFDAERKGEQKKQKQAYVVKRQERHERKFMKKLSEAVTGLAAHAKNGNGRVSLSKSPCARNLGLSILNRRILDDLMRLRDHWGGTIPVGKRNFWLFVASVCAARLVSADVLPLEVVRLGHLAGIDESEALRTMGSVIRRAQDAEIGKTITWNGMEVDPRYKFKMETIIMLLGLNEETIRDAGLELIITEDMKKERERHRKARNRNQVTAPRSQSAIMEALSKKNTLIMELLPTLSLRQIAARVKCSVALVQKVKSANLNKPVLLAA